MVKENKDENQKDEVRLLKKFLKVNGLYGAEIKVQGFSGYLCELLILKYKTFMNAIENIAKWKERTYIDIENYYKEEEGLNKFQTPLVVIDPVDKERNVSAVLSVENYFSLIALASSFLKSKDQVSFFEKREFTLAQLKNFITTRAIYCISFKTPPIVEDVLWGQVRRYYSALFSLLKKEEFKVIGHHMGKCGENVCMLVEILNEMLPENKVVQGPPLQFGKDCEKFSKQYKHADLFIEDGRICAKTRRDVRTIEGMLTKIRNLPLPSHLSSARHARLFKRDELLKECKEVLEDYASRRFLLR